MVSTVNGDATYCADGSSNCALYYVLNDYTSSSSPELSSVYRWTVNLYYSAAPAINLLNQSSPTNIATITSIDTVVAT